jgi:hypothetical protein
MNEGPHALLARRVGGGESPIVEVREPYSPVTLVIGGGGTIAGTVTDAAGKHVPEFAVVVDDDARNLTIGGRQFTDGAFRWPNLAAGAYRVTVSAGHRGAEATTAVKEGADVAVAIKLPPSFTITGRVVDAVSREPIRGAEISVTLDMFSHDDEDDHDGSRRRYYTSRDAEQSTDADGRFTVDDAVRGTYHLTIKADAGHLSTNQTVKVKVANIDLGEITVPRARN